MQNFLKPLVVEKCFNISICGFYLLASLKNRIAQFFLSSLEYPPRHRILDTLYCNEWIIQTVRCKTNTDNLIYSSQKYDLN